MSITIHKQPQELTPVYNQMVIAVTGSYQTQPNYQFVASLYVDGTLASNIKVPVNPDGYGVFDIQRHVENQVTHTFEPDYLGWTQAVASVATYSVNFSEEFRYEWRFIDNAFDNGSLAFVGITGSSEPLFNVGDQIVVAQDGGFTNYSYEGSSYIIGITLSGSNWVITTDKSFGSNSPAEGGTISLANYALTTVAGGATISTQFAWNGVYSWLDFINYDYTDYVPDTGTPCQWLTNVPDNWEVGTQSRMRLQLYKNAANQQKDLLVQTNRGIYRLTGYSTGSDNDRITQIGVGPWDIINGSASFITGTSSYPIFDDNTATYSVWVRNQILQQDTETKVFKLKDWCSRYEQIQLVFMDKLGSFVPYTFNKVNRHTKQMTRTDYQQIYGSYAPSSQAWEYNSWDRGRKRLDLVVNDVYVINSDWVTQTTSDYLMELFESPEVFWIKEDGTTIAITITDQSVERKQTINDQIINYTLTFELSNKSNTQRG